MNEMPRRALKACRTFRPTLGARVTLAAAVAAAALFAAPTGASAAGSCSLGSFSAGNWPCSSWRPYSPSSPFNTRIGSHPQVESSSQSIVDRLNRGGHINSLVAGDADRGASPTFWSTPDDPAYRIQCESFGGNCAVSGMEVHIPRQAVPEGGFATLQSCDGCSANEGNWDHDAHMTIVDQSSGWEYDFWAVHSIGDGVVKIGWGGRTQIEGDGLGSGGVAAGFGNLAGVIRGTEFASGQIDHALTIAVPCVTGTVWPAQGKAYECAQHGMPGGDRLQLGSRVQLQISDSELAQLPTWQRGIARAMRDYGAYVNDTTGDESQWGPSLESAGTYTDFGYSDPAAGVTPSDDTGDYNHNGIREKWFYLFKRIDWSELRVLAPCDPSAGCNEGPPPVGSEQPDPNPVSRPALTASGSTSARSSLRSARSHRHRGNAPSSVLRSRRGHRASAVRSRNPAAIRGHGHHAAAARTRPALARGNVTPTS
ncbi:MAG: hypothetical protein ACRDK1_09705 [Solirubrobacterales bacterium]